MRTTKTARTALVTAVLALSLTGTLVAPASAHSAPVSTVSTISTEKVAPAAKKKAKTVKLRVTSGLHAYGSEAAVFNMLKVTGDAKPKSDFRKGLRVKSRITVKRGNKIFRSKTVSTTIDSMSASPDIILTNLPVKKLRKSDRVSVRTIVLGFDANTKRHPKKGTSIKGKLKDGTRVIIPAVVDTRVHVR